MLSSPPRTLASSSSLPADVAGQAERELLAAVNDLVGDMGNRAAAVIEAVAVQFVQSQLGGLLRAAAVHGLSADAAAAVGGRIDHAMRSKPVARWAPIQFSVARDQSGKVIMSGLFDINSFNLSFEGDYSSKYSNESMPSQTLSFKGAPGVLPVAQLVLPPPQIVIHNNPAPATRQQVNRDANGEIESILTEPA